MKKYDLFLAFGCFVIMKWLQFCLSQYLVKQMQAEIPHFRTAKLWKT
jgi:hypothetical protein